MYNILIVDDEYYICEGLHQKIRQIHFTSIREIKTCLSGEEAIELCKIYKPQIVFTDIKMSGMNGLELIKILSQKLHPVQFIILSGYDDFDYVRGAFQNGAIDYLLKPILNDKLVNVLTTAFTNLTLHPDISSNLRKTLFQISSDIFREITVLPADEILQPSLHSYCYNAGIKQECCIAMLVSKIPQPSEEMNKLINTIYDQFTQILCNTLSEYRIGIICDSQKQKLLEEFLSSFVSTPISENIYNLSIVPNNEWSASITTSAPITCIPALFRKAEELLCLRLTKGYGILFTEIFSLKEQGISPKLKHLMSQFIENPSLISNNMQRTTFCREIKKLSILDLNHFYHYFNRILDIACFNSHVSNWNYKEYSVADFSNYNDLEIYFYEKIIEYSQKISSQIQPPNSIDMIRKYIDDHYMEDLTLSSLADRFFVSYSYLSKTFHKTFKMSFQEYLRMLRMERALELLKNTDWTIQQISSSVGYENAFNFSRSFKAQYGVSPSHFRNTKPTS